MASGGSFLDLRWLCGACFWSSSGFSGLGFGFPLASGVGLRFPLASVGSFLELR